MKPVQLIVDDDPQVLQAVGIDLRHKYGDRFRVLKADSGATALGILKASKLWSYFTRIVTVCSLIFGSPKVAKNLLMRSNNLSTTPSSLL
jgi:hypothetical protein